MCTRDDTFPCKLVELLQIRQVRITRADLHLHPVWLGITIVEPRALRKHGNHTFTSFLALYECSDVVAEFLLAATDEASEVSFEANAARAKELAFTLRPLVKPPVARSTASGMRLEFGIETTEANGRLLDAFTKNATGLAALSASTPPDGNSATRNGRAAGTIPAVGTTELTKLDVRHSDD